MDPHQGDGCGAGAVAGNVPRTDRPRYADERIRSKATLPEHRVASQDGRGGSSDRLPRLLPGTHGRCPGAPRHPVPLSETRLPYVSILPRTDGRTKTYPGSNGDGLLHTCHQMC